MIRATGSQAWAERDGVSMFSLDNFHRCWVFTVNPSDVFRMAQVVKALSGALCVPSLFCFDASCTRAFRVGHTVTHRDKA
jgi:hypothetical protein